MVYSIVANRAGYAAGGPYTLYTVPAGKVFIMRDIDARLQTTGASDLFFGEGTTSQFFVRMKGAVVQDVGTWRGRQVFNAGETVAAFVDAGLWNWAISGYLLIG